MKVSHLEVNEYNANLVFIRTLHYMSLAYPTNLRKGLPPIASLRRYQLDLLH